MHDLLAVEVNNPSTFPGRLGVEETADLISIEPIPLQSSADFLSSDVWLGIAHFPWDRDADHRAKCLEWSVGLKRIVNVCQGKPTDTACC